MMEELSIGLDGFTSRITTKDGKYLGHDHYVNPYVERVPGFDATAYPLSFDIKAYDTVNGTDTSQTASGSDTCWEIEAPYYVPEEENEDYYVSIQSANKPGLYITANNRGIRLRMIIPIKRLSVIKPSKRLRRLTAAMEYHLKAWHIRANF